MATRSRPRIYVVAIPLSRALGDSGRHPLHITVAATWFADEAQRYLKFVHSQSAPFRVRGSRRVVRSCRVDGFPACYTGGEGYPSPPMDASHWREWKEGREEHVYHVANAEENEELIADPSKAYLCRPMASSGVLKDHLLSGGARVDGAGFFGPRGLTGTRRRQHDDLRPRCVRITPRELLARAEAHDEIRAEAEVPLSSWRSSSLAATGPEQPRSGKSEFEGPPNSRQSRLILRAPNRRG